MTQGRTIVVSVASLRKGGGRNRMKIVRFIALVFAAAAVVAVCSLVWRDQAQGGLGKMYGDLNCDGRVSAVDAALTLQLTAAVLGDVACRFTGDVNRNGAIDAADAALILQHTAGLIPKFGPAVVEDGESPGPQPTAEPLPPPTFTPCEAPECALMALQITSPDAVCNGAEEPARCDVPSGSSFTVSVDLLTIPASGYIGLQTLVAYGDLVYQESADPTADIVWPDATGFNLRRIPYPDISMVAHAAATALIPPFPVSHYAGSLVEMSFICGTSPPTHEILLIAYSPVRTFGSGLKVPPSYGDSGTRAAKAVSQEIIDRYGTLPLLIADRLTINCMAP